MNLKINNTFILGIILAFNLMLINYLGDFNEGSINSYGGIKIILKIISITLICLLSKVNKYFIKSNYLLIIFFIVYLVLVVIRVPFNESRDIMFLNTFISLPLIILLLIDAEIVSTIRTIAIVTTSTVPALGKSLNLN